MKKGLSVLLIVAALFGFYGGASSLTDVLACKDYWEKEGEKSTADMNKLEDGLNQLGENEQAYLDGVQQLADGEAQLAEGRATLAKGEADYAAAPGKLRAAEAAIADGEGKLDDLATLLDGISQVHDGYEKMSAYETLKAGRDQTLADVRNPNSETSKNSTLLATLLTTLATGGDADAAAALQSMGKAAAILQDPSKQVIGSYTDEQWDGFYEAMGYQMDGLASAKKALNSFSDALSGYADNVKTSPAYIAAYYGQLRDLIAMLGGSEKYKMPAPLDVLPAQTTSEWWDWAYANYNTAYSAGAQQVAAGILSKMSASIGDKAGDVQTTYNTAKTAHDGIYTLKNSDADKKKAVGGVAQIISGVYGSKNKTLIKGFEKAAKAADIKLNDFRYAATSKLAKDMNSKSSIDDFYNDLKDVDKCFQKAKATAKKLKADGEKQLKAGKKQYAQGLADYKAAPGKLADGRKQLAEGEKQLADGKKQLAQYEDGEQQVRDGLATLMSTEPNGGLESILDRRGGDDEFDDANGHLDVQEGLDAVKVGRGYQADSGELITKEITNRAVGTAAGLGAAVLACLAALLSLIKKYKGAAVSAVLAAIAGVAGAVIGSGAGSEFSDIAGSTVGSLPWIAAGVVAAVACVFAIVNFTAKAE